MGAEAGDVVLEHQAWLPRTGNPACPRFTCFYQILCSCAPPCRLLYTFNCTS
jgi:hypothetical protein